MNPLRIFLLAALVLVVFGMNTAGAEDPPEIEWNNSFEDNTYGLKHNYLLQHLYYIYQ